MYIIYLIKKCKHFVPTLKYAIQNTIFTKLCSFSRFCAKARIVAYTIDTHLKIDINSEYNNEKRIYLYDITHVYK